MDARIEIRRNRKDKKLLRAKQKQEIVDRDVHLHPEGKWHLEEADCLFMLKPAFKENKMNLF